MVMDIAGVTRIVGIKETRIISVSRTVVVSSRTKGDTAVAGMVVRAAKETGIRIRSKILNTRIRGSKARAKLRATRAQMTRTRTRTGGPPTHLRTRTRCLASSTDREVATITTAATNLISIPTKR